MSIIAHAFSEQLIVYMEYLIWNQIFDSLPKNEMEWMVKKNIAAESFH